MWYSQENTCVWVSFLLKLWAFRSLTVLKRDFNTDIFWWVLGNLYKHLFWRTSSSHERCSLRKDVLQILQNSQETPGNRVSFQIKLPTLVWNFNNKNTLAQMFSCKFWEICKNSFFTEHLWATASEEHLLTAASAFLETVW